ncbi:hypothetical protein HQ393_13770 [Chitinibacter bivalviorum]|uniref:DUF2147 domain-containing protein n=1 Tax=Chitinibacter bivalviorum TaxID=2739434 RepID=A0A7H9BLE2_9NEIS|nr:hypothetical protein [Chitinibacter bivalviorum]QLG89222.1 hypothetical protein HQ393_13770 [Chitinibacter bivalviorum]
MKMIAIAALLGLNSVAFSAQTQVMGVWTEKQRIESIKADEASWQWQGGGQSLNLATPPHQFSPPQVGDWFELNMRHNPAGVMRKLMWSHEQQEAPWLIVGLNLPLAGEAMPGWRWEAGPVLVKGKLRIQVPVGKLTQVRGWCVLISDFRGAKPSTPGVANETETRLDWWAQQTKKPCIY